MSQHGDILTFLTIPSLGKQSLNKWLQELIQEQRSRLVQWKEAVACMNFFFFFSLWEFSTYIQRILILFVLHSLHNSSQFHVPFDSFMCVCGGGIHWRDKLQEPVTIEPQVGLGAQVLFPHPHCNADCLGQALSWNYDSKGLVLPSIYYFSQSSWHLALKVTPLPLLKYSVSLKRCPYWGWVFHRNSLCAFWPVVDLCMNHCPLLKQVSDDQHGWPSSPSRKKMPLALMGTVPLSSPV